MVSDPALLLSVRTEFLDAPLQELSKACVTVVEIEQETAADIPAGSVVYDQVCPPLEVATSYLQVIFEPTGTL